LQAVAEEPPCSAATGAPLFSHAFLELSFSPRHTLAVSFTPREALLTPCGRASLRGTQCEWYVRGSGVMRQRRVCTILSVYSPTNPGVYGESLRWRWGATCGRPFVRRAPHMLLLPRTGHAPLADRARNAPLTLPSLPCLERCRGLAGHQDARRYTSWISASPSPSCRRPSAHVQRPQAARVRASPRPQAQTSGR
jgi:hypothetical protein